MRSFLSPWKSIPIFLLNRLMPQLLIRAQHLLHAVETIAQRRGAARRQKAGHQCVGYATGFVGQVAPPGLRKARGRVVRRAGDGGRDALLAGDECGAQAVEGIGDDGGVGKREGFLDRAEGAAGIHPLLHRVHGQVREVLAQVVAADAGLSKPIPGQLAAHGNDLQSLGGGELTGVAQSAGQNAGGAAIVLGGS